MQEVISPDSSMIELLPPRTLTTNPQPTQFESHRPPFAWGKTSVVCFSLHKYRALRLLDKWANRACDWALRTICCLGECWKVLIYLRLGACGHLNEMSTWEV